MGTVVGSRATSGVMLKHDWKKLDDESKGMMGLVIYWALCASEFFSPY